MPLIVVAGALANRPGNAGGAWVRLGWIRGLERLGCDVRFVEQIARANVRDAMGGRVPLDRSPHLAFFRGVVESFGLEGRASLLVDDGSIAYGVGFDELRDTAAAADLLVNITGHLTHEPLFGRFRRRAYLDIDPGFTQYWAADRRLGASLAAHDRHFTIGENIGRDDCAIPTAGIRWRPTRQPVVLDDWPVRSAAFDRFTTIASWRGTYGRLDHQGRLFGSKAHEFRRFLDVPSRAGRPFEIALDIHAADTVDRVRLERAGWRIVAPSAAVPDPARFREYIQRSGAEFSAAQGVYVETRSGWFSDRTARYLASGKPALVQDTGFGRQLPTGLGLVAFSTLEEAVAGVNGIVRYYPEHCEAARSLAETHFGSDGVLSRFLCDCDVS